jgi:hypothetical protein
MSEDELKKAELRGYARGYIAGKRRKRDEITRESIRHKRDAFWQRAFTVVLPATFSAKDWVRGDKPITTLKDRVKLAAEIADEATEYAVTRL